VTHENKDKKLKKRPALKNGFVFRDDHQNFDATAYLSKFQEKCYSLT